MAECMIPPKGWYCDRLPGHEGRCRVSPDADTSVLLPELANMLMGCLVARPLLEPQQRHSIVAAANVLRGVSDQDYSCLEDDISDAIDDSLDLDWTSNLGAKAVMRVLRTRGIVP